MGRWDKASDAILSPEAVSDWSKHEASAGSHHDEGSEGG
jgi:hypothetical protein